MPGYLCLPTQQGNAHRVLRKLEFSLISRLIVLLLVRSTPMIIVPGTMMIESIQQCRNIILPSAEACMLLHVVVSYISAKVCTPRYAIGSSRARAPSPRSCIMSLPSCEPPPIHDTVRSRQCRCFFPKVKDSRVLTVTCGRAADGTTSTRKGRAPGRLNQYFQLASCLYYSHSQLWLILFGCAE